jgi:hypothetical protein
MLITPGATGGKELPLHYSAPKSLSRFGGELDFNSFSVDLIKTDLNHRPNNGYSTSMLDLSFKSVPLLNCPFIP